MPKVHHMPEAHTEHPNVVPLIDVMLCIIVFYMLAAKIGVESGADKDIRLTAVTFGKQLKDVGTTGQLIINVRELLDQPFVSAAVSDGSGTPIGSSGLYELKVVDPSTGKRHLYEFLRRVRMGPDGKENTPDDNKDMKVTIRGDAEMPYRTFFPVLKDVMDAGVKNIFHAAEKPQGTVEEAT